MNIFLFLFCFFCVLINIRSILCFSVEIQAVFLTPGLPVLMPSSDVLGSNPFYPPAKFLVEMSLLFSKVTLYCERSNEKRESWTRLASVGIQAPKFTVKTHRDAFTEEDATETVFRVIYRVALHVSTHDKGICLRKVSGWKSSSTFLSDHLKSIILKKPF